MRRRRGSVLVAAVLGSGALLAACGQSSRSAGPQPSTGTSAAGTAASTPAGTVAAACTQPGWLSVVSPTDAPAGYAQAAAPLQADQAAVEQWGSQNASMFSASWIGFDGTKAQLVVALAGTSDAPASLRAAVSKPDSLVICQHRHARAELDKLAGQIGPPADGIEDVRVDGGNDAVAVVLASDRADKAAHLHDQFGDAVRLTVGLLPYPLVAGSGAVSSGPCRPLPDAAAASGLSAQLVMGATSVGRGGQAHGVVHVRNTGTQPVDLPTVQPLDAVLLQPGSKKVVGALTATVDPGSTGGKLGPGETLSLPVLAGTDSCDPALGYMVPPGSYDVVAVVPGAGARGRGPTVVSDPAELTITG